MLSRKVNVVIILLYTSLSFMKITLSRLHTAEIRINGLSMTYIAQYILSSTPKVFCLHARFSCCCEINVQVFFLKTREY